MSVRKCFLSLIFCISAIGATGCTTTYWVDRGRDAADIFTVGVGYGIGVQGRVGPLVPGIGMHASVIGLESGEFFADTSECPSVSLF